MHGSVEIPAQVRQLQPPSAPPGSGDGAAAQCGAAVRRVAASPLLTGGALLLLALLLRLPAFFSSVLDIDEGLYVLQAREWLRGGWPFVAVWDMHPPGAPALLAGAFLLAGESVFALRLLGAVAVATTGFLLYRLVRSAAAGPPEVGLGAGALYVAHTLLSGGLATNTELLLAPFVCAAVAAAIAAARRSCGDSGPEREGGGGGVGGAPPGWRDMLRIGLPIGLALLVKPVVVPLGMVAFAGPVVLAWARGTLRPGAVVRLALCYAAFCVAPTLAVALLYALQGQLEAFLHAVVVAPLQFSEARTPTAEMVHAVLKAGLAFFWLFVLSLPALLGWGRRLLRGGGRRPDAALSWPMLLPPAMLLWFAAATAAVLLPGKSWQHYFLLWLPPLAVLGALGAAGLARLARPAAATALFACLAGVAVLAPCVGMATERIGRGVALRAPDPPREVARALMAQGLLPGEPIFVAMYHPMVYFLAGAALPTPYVFPRHLIGGFREITGTDPDAELARVLATRPRFVVLGGIGGPAPERAAAQLSAALARDYERTAVLPDPSGPVAIYRLRR